MAAPGHKGGCARSESFAYSSLPAFSVWGLARAKFPAYRPAFISQQLDPKVRVPEMLVLLP